ncbi:hypothetical protein MT418_003572 [Batrachochytrium dendrobatidis]
MATTSNSITDSQSNSNTPEPCIVDDPNDNTPLMDDMREIVVNLSETARAGASAATKSVVTFWNDFGDFVDKGPVVELGIGVITGAAFSSVLTSFVEDILTPPLSFLSSDGSSIRNMFFVLKHGLSNSTLYPTLESAKADGAVTINFGMFADRLVSFFITMLVMFWFIRIYRQAKRQLAALRREKEDEEQEQVTKCQWCRSSIDPEAYRCPNCTALLDTYPPGRGPPLPRKTN